MTDRNRVLACYRFFGVDHRQVVLWEDSADCLDDEEACAAAGRRALSGETIEVWDVARLVGRCGAPASAS